ncbi:MAG: Fic family protein, partial [Desulfobacterales bacterium]|nr:Fic family protein [Desulfobacterales bacterium]
MEFLTHKFGKFYFIHEYANHKAIDALLIEARVRHETINDLPVLPELASKLEPDILYSSIAGTAAIEDNPIPAEGVKELAENKDIEGYAQKHKQEITNLLNCYDILSDLSKDSSSVSLRISEDYIRKVHSVLTVGVPDDRNVPGQYRNGEVLVGNIAHGGVYKPPKSLEDIKNLMAKYIEWLNCDEILQLNPFIRAALAHYHFSLIHPFWDGNGRTARLIETAILEGA